MEMDRRQFLRAGLAAGATSAIPAPLARLARAAATAAHGSAAEGGARTAAGTTPVPAGTGLFLKGRRWATCRALCSRVVPTGSDPATDPGATEADAVLFIDRYLSAFELPRSLADNPAIWISGPYSGRNPEPDTKDGRPSSTFPPDSMLSRQGQARFLALTRPQHLAWVATLYGPEALAGEIAAGAAGGTRATAAARAWAAQMASGSVPAPPAGGQRGLYAAGLDAFDAWCQSSFGSHYADASPEEQDALLYVAGDPVVGGLSAAPLPSPPAPPAAASALFSALLVHTYQACYGLPEYRWSHANPLWKLIGYDGDTQPLGSTIYDANAKGAGVDQGPNQGFGMKGVYQPSGDYVEYRPVSHLAPGASIMSPQQEEKWVPVILRVIRKGGR